MPQSDGDRLFTGSIPQLYDDYMVPMIFEPYAVDLAARVAKRRPTSLLEVAAGTGAVTRRLARDLAPEARMVVTDLNQAMLDRAAAVGLGRPVEWRQADAMQLPFADQSFDVVVCQFGAMFFPDKPQAFAEARRVLRPGGAYVFNVWDGLEHNVFAQTVSQALQQMFPADPPRFMERVPHGYGDPEAIRRDLAAGGFRDRVQLHTLAEQSRAASPALAAMAYCQGTPLRSEIETRGPGRLQEATDLAAQALAQRFGTAAVQGLIQAHVIVAER
jgi:ubiquinone/menaquinone biosynthesis C-methylase UbiE